MTGKSPMLINIQVLRFWAALAVVLFHASQYVAAAGGSAGVFTAFGAVGFAGVDVFFVISGFVIWHTTTALRGAGQGLDFMYRRAARIYTGYWPHCLAFILLLWALNPARLSQIALLDSLTLWPSPIPGLLLGVSWTLSYELYFYLAFAVLLLFSLRWRLALVAGLFLIALCVQALLWASFELHTLEGFGQFSYLARFFMSPFVLEFLAGVLLAACYHRLRPSPVLLLIMAMILLVLAVLVQEMLVGESLGLGFHQFYRVPLLGGAAFFLVWAALALEQRGMILGRRLGLFMGGMSYSLYLSHAWLLWLFGWLGLHHWLAQMGLLQAGVGLFCLFIILYSGLHYRFVERPLHAASLRLRRLWRADGKGKARAVRGGDHES